MHNILTTLCSLDTSRGLDPLVYHSFMLASAAHSQFNPFEVHCGVGCHVILGIQHMQMAEINSHRRWPI